MDEKIVRKAAEIVVLSYGQRIRTTFEWEDEDVTVEFGLYPGQTIYDDCDIEIISGPDFDYGPEYRRFCDEARSSVEQDGKAYADEEADRQLHYMRDTGRM